MSSTLDETLSLCNLVLTQIFTVELVIKLVGSGLGPFLLNSWYVFDAIIVVFAQVTRLSRHRPRAVATAAP